MCGSAVFCVSRTYCSSAPAAEIASGRSSAPKPRRSSVPSWSVSRREALDSSKCQGGRTRAAPSSNRADLARMIFGNQQLGGLEPLEFGLQRRVAVGFQHGETAGGEIQPREAEAAPSFAGRARRPRLTRFRGAVRAARRR